MPTIIRRLMRTVPLVAGEWICAFSIFGVGVIMLLWPGSFMRPDLANFLQILSPSQWTALCVLTGTVRLSALVAFTGPPIYIDANAPPTMREEVAAMLRIASSVAGSGIFATFLGRSINNSDTTSVSFTVALYGVLFVTELANTKRACSDVVRAIRARKYAHVVLSS